MTPHDDLPTVENIVEAVRRDVRRDCGPDIDVRRIGERLEGGFDKILVHLEIEGVDWPSDRPRHVVARVFPDAGQHDKAAREQTVQEYCRRSGFPAARVISRGTVGASAYLLIEFIGAPPAVVHLSSPGA